MWFERAIFSSLLAVIALAAVPFGAVEPWWEAIFESAIFMLGACWISTSMIGKRLRMPAMMLAPIGALIVFACLQTLPLWHANFSPDLMPGISRTLSANPFETKRFVIKSLSIGLTLAMLLSYTSSRKRLLALAQLVIIVGAASAAFGICRKLLPATEFASLWNSKLQGESFGQFMNRNHFALLMEMSLGLALGLAFYAGYGAKRCLYAATALLICVALVLANSRGGIISMLGQFGFLSWMYFGVMFHRPSLKPRAYGQTGGAHRFWRTGQALALRCVLILFLMGAAFGCVMWLGGEPVRQRLETVPSEFLKRSDNLESRSPRRLEIWSATRRLIEAHPLLGSGFGAYKTAVTEYLRAPDEWQPQQAHNEYLELVAGGGIIGAALGVWFVLILIREARKRLQGRDALGRAVCLGALVGLVGVAIHSLVDFGLHVTVNALVCCALIALATAHVRLAPTDHRSVAGC